MELSELIFKSNTEDLERVSKVIGGLVTDISKLDKASRDAAKTEATLAKAAKDHADANLQNAKAQDVRLKTTITADKADQQAATAIEKKTKATERATVAAKRNVDMLQLQNDTYDFILEGFSKGDAKVLAMAKATGQLSDQLKQVLTDIRQFSKNTFDQTETGLDRMVKSAKEASAAQGFLNQGFNLTAKQAKELGNDLDRLNIRLQHQGKSYDEIVKAQAVYKQQFLEEAKTVNQANNALATVEKQRKDVVSATNYMTQAEAKMAAALNTSNAALDKAGTDLLVKYETALRKSGVSQDVATAKLEKYKVQLAQVQEQEQRRREQHLTRALAPQATDVVVSLWSGQNPLTVLLQQGGQVTDLFMQSGIAAEKFGEVVKSSMKSMLPSILTVVKGVGGLLVDGFMAAGIAVRGFLAASIGITGALDKMYLKMSEKGPSKWGGVIRGLSSLLSGVFAVGVAAVVTGLISLGVALTQVTKEQNELAKSLNLTGASLGLSADGVIKFAQSIEGVRTTEAISFIQELSKTGVKASADLTGLTKVAVDLEKYGGVALKDTAKAYDDLQSKPFEGLMKLAEGTGQVSQETVDLAVKLKLAGDEVGLLKLANDQFIAANGKAIDSIKEEINPMSALWITVKEGISFAWDGLKDFARTGVVLNTFIASLRVIATGALVIGAIFRGLGKTIALAFSVYAETASAMNPFSTTTKEQAVKNIQGVFAAYKDDMSDWKKQTESAFNDIWGKTEKTTGLTDAARAANSNYATSSVNGLGDLEKAYNSIEKSELKKLTRQQAINKAIEDYTQKNKQASQYQLDIIRQGAGIAWDKAQKEPKKDPSENYYATLMREATNNTIAANTATQELTKSEQKLLEVKADPRFAKLTTTQQADVIAKYDAAIAAERQTAMTEKLAEAEEHRLKLLGKSEGIGKQYYADMQKLEEFAKVAGWSREEIEELTRAVFKSTPAWKAYEKALEDVNTASRKFQEDSLASQSSVSQENRSLDHRLSLLGKTTEEQKALTIEYNRANKLREVDVKLAKQLRTIEDEIEKAKKRGLQQKDYQVLIDAELQARKDAAEEQKVINREVAVQYAEDLQKEIDAIRNGITDSIVTALFEGGKAGSKKVREVFTNIMRQKVTMVVDVAVNAFINNLVGSAANSLSGGGGGGLGGLSGLSNLWDMVSSGSNIAAVFGQKIAMQAGGWLANVGMETASQMVGQFGAGMMNTSSIGAFTSAFEAGGAQMAGAIAGSVLNGFSGYSVSKLISGGYEVNKYVNKIAGVASAIPGIGPIAGVIGGTINRLFGRKLKESGIEGTFSGETGFEGRTYQFYKGGLFRSNKTKYGELDEETRSNFAKSFFDMKSGVTEMAKILGVGTESLEDFTYKFKVNLKGLSEEEATKAIQEQFKLMGEEMTKLVLSTDEYSLAEETRMDTLVRLSATLSTVNTIFENMGMTMYELGLSGADAAYELTQLFGGLDKFTSVLSNYYEKFYSDSEKQILLQSQLDRAFKDLGVSAPKTREEFRALVEVQDLTTEGGRKTFTELMKLVDGFDVLTSQAEQLAEEIASAAEEARKNAIEAAYSALETAVNAQKEILKVQESAQTEVVNNLKSIFDLLKKNVRELYMQVGSTAGMLASQGRGVISNAISTGTLPDSDTLTGAISAVRSEIDSSSYATQFEQDKARLQFAAELQILQDQAGSQLSVAELTLKAIKDQTAYLDGLLKSSREQIDAALGITNVLLSVEAALQAITDILKPPVDETKPKAPGSGGGFVIGGGGGMGATTVYNRDADLKAQIDRQLQFAEADGRGFDDPRTLKFVNAALYGFSASNADIARLYNVPKEDIDRLFSGVGITRYADGGTFTNGVVTKPTMFNASQMGEAGPEAIMPLTNIGGRLGVSAVGSDNSALADKVERLESALQVIAVNTSKVARILDAAQGTDGRSLITTPAA